MRGPALAALGLVLGLTLAGCTTPVYTCVPVALLTRHGKEVPGLECHAFEAPVTHERPAPDDETPGDST